MNLQRGFIIWSLLLGLSFCASLPPLILEIIQAQDPGVLESSDPCCEETDSENDTIDGVFVCRTAVPNALLPRSVFSLSAKPTTREANFQHRHLRI